MATILVTDDDQVTRLHIGSLLEGMGHEVRYASNGEECLALDAEHHFDIIVLDLAMPVKNGFVTIRELRQRRKVSVVAVSGRVADQFDFATEAGAAYTLSKPVNPAELAGVIRAIVESGSAWDHVFV